MKLGECYKILDLSPGADLDEVKRAYKAKVKIWHPDRFSGDAGLQSLAEENTKKVNLAYGRITADLKSRPPRKRPVPSTPRTPTDRPGPPRPSQSHSTQTGADNNQEKPPGHPGSPFWESVRDFVGNLRDKRRHTAARPPGAGPHSRHRKSAAPPRRTPFNQVLEEVSTSGTRPRPMSTRRRVPSPWYRLMGRRGRGGRGGGAVKGVQETRRVNPVRPVDRIRGIGRNR